MHDFQSLIHDLENSGVAPDSVVIIHSSMKRIGRVDGGADTVIDALMEYFKDGLLVMPALTYTLFHDYAPDAPGCIKCLADYPAGHCLAKDFYGRTPEFHVNSTPVCIGLLPEIFRKRPQVVRSLNPSHSVAAYGKRSEEFIAGHEKSITPCGKLSPWYKLYEYGGKIIHLGSPLTSTTFMHGVCEWLNPDDLTPLIPNPVKVFDRFENPVVTPALRITAGSANVFDRLAGAPENAAEMRNFKFADTVAAVLDCRKLLQYFEKNKNLLN